MKKHVFVSVSTEPIKDYQAITEYAHLMQGKADFLHCDVMDGNFVKAVTYDAQLVGNINQHSLIMLDVHLMCDEPLRLIDEYVAAGANILTVHYEAFKDKNDIIAAVKKIKERHMLAGLAINPETEIKDIKMYIHDFDIILVMSVEPGAGGQQFMPSALEKIRQLDQIRTANDFKYKIEVDGGVNDENAPQIIGAGGDILVSGSYVYKSADREQAISNLRG